MFEFQPSPIALLAAGDESPVHTARVRAGPATSQSTLCCLCSLAVFLLPAHPETWRCIVCMLKFYHEISIRPSASIAYPMAGH